MSGFIEDDQDLKEIHDHFSESTLAVSGSESVLKQGLGAASLATMGMCAVQLIRILTMIAQELRYIRKQLEHRDLR